MKTAELKVTEMTTKKVVIKVLKYAEWYQELDSPVIKEGGIFSSTVINFLMEIQPFGWQIMRSYGDCLWLRDQLVKNFPATIV